MKGKIISDVYTRNKNIKLPQIFQLGNSWAIYMPKRALRRYKWTAGDKIFLKIINDYTVQVTNLKVKLCCSQKE